MRRALLLLGIASASVGLGQSLPTPAPTPIRIPVFHADPWFIVAMLEGRPVVSPEISTLFTNMGMPPQVSQGLNSLFKGRFIVNAADNSIWFYPGQS